MKQSRDASCLCGAVLIRAHGALRRVVFCHCSQCRKQTGLYFAATKVADEQLEVDGQESISWYQASDFAKRGFCRICGSALFWKVIGSNATSIMAGQLEQRSGLEPAMHIFTADKGDYYDICDGLPQHERSTGDVPVARNNRVCAKPRLARPSAEHLALG